MQFTVLIEFLVPGLATTLLLLFLLPVGTVLKLPQGLPTGETASALLLLAVSYPVGILTNFPIFEIQRRVISKRARRAVFVKYEKIGVDLVSLIITQFDIMPDKLPVNDREKFSLLFPFMSAFVFTNNSQRLYSNHTYHEGLQRLARGILLPLLLASIVVCRNQTPGRYLLVVLFSGLAVSACILVRHSVHVEYEQLVRYFLVLTNIEQRPAVTAGRGGTSSLLNKRDSSPST